MYVRQGCIYSPLLPPSYPQVPLDRRGNSAGLPRPDRISERVPRHEEPTFSGLVWPTFHWTDSRIRVHAFYCVLALRLTSLLQRRRHQHGLDLSLTRMMQLLGGIEGVLLNISAATRPESVPCHLFDRKKKRRPNNSFSCWALKHYQSAVAGPATIEPITTSKKAPDDGTNGVVFLCHWDYIFFFFFFFFFFSPRRGVAVQLGTAVRFAVLEFLDACISPGDTLSIRYPVNAAEWLAGATCAGVEALKMESERRCGGTCAR